MRNRWVGIFLLAVTLINPNVGIAGFLATLSAHLFARFIHLDPSYMESGFFTYNPLLVGLSIGYLFELTPLSIFFVVTAGISAIIVTTMLNSIFSYYFKLPILSIPFVLVSSTSYLAASKYSNLFTQYLYPRVTDLLQLQMPYWIAGYLKSLGAIFFIPDVWGGLILAVLILLASRILFLLSIGGYYTGTLIIALMNGSFPAAFADINHFNFILIALAVGGVFMIPSPRSYIMALIAVVVSTVILESTLVFWAYYSLPVFTLPFNLTTLTFIYVLGLVDDKYIAKTILYTPEQTLDNFLAHSKRFHHYQRTLTLPFSGTWTVYQAFDDRWTHKGQWKYAYDFVINDEQGNNYRYKGTELSDYYAFKKPVLSPVRGRIVKIIDHLPDNPIGSVDKVNNWGNLVVIHDERGYYIELSHFAQQSIKVKEGDWVERGSILGLCGNSGYSPEPHIHVQVQAYAEVGSYTLPFSFINYLVEGRFYTNDLPKVEQRIEPLPKDKMLDARLSFILDDTLEFNVKKRGIEQENLKLTVKMADDGTFYFESDLGKLYFGKQEDAFFIYRLDGLDPRLNALMKALPHMPLGYREQIKWQDILPLSAILKGFKKHLLQLSSSFYHPMGEIKGEYQFNGNREITGTLGNDRSVKTEHTSITFNERGINTIKTSDYELTRITSVNDRH